MPVTADEKFTSVRVIHERYQFRKKLAQGGFCDVFLAEERTSGRKVAIKMMEIGAATEKTERRIARFRREMQLYNQLDHPNIVKVLDSGETETGLLFIVFEYVPGVNLAQLLQKEGALTINRTITLMSQLLSALNEAHTRGIIHRDLKPENIMIVSAYGNELVKILDFGISTFISGQLNESPRITGTKEFLGTPMYAAPEQLRGEPVTVKVDIYAWGLLFLETLTGRSPFTGKTVAAIVQQQLATTPVPLPAALINHRLGFLLRWTLEKNTNRRAGNAAILESHLESVATDTIVQTNGYLTGEVLTTGDDTKEIPIYETITSQKERRQVTVVSVSLDTNNGKGDDFPDVLDEIYQDLMAFGSDLFTKYGAHVNLDSGDRILAVFGWPDASDTDARRAARSALEFALSIERRNTIFSIRHGMQFSYRIGINTDMVTVRKRTVDKPLFSGLTCNVAGKLCTTAEPNSILMSKSSCSLLKDIVEYREITPDTIDVPHSGESVYKMIGERQMKTSMETDTLSPMVGRDGEMNRLSDTLATTGSTGSGKILLITGEAGIGKSRLAAEFAKKVTSENRGWMECRCLPERKNSALYPALEFIRNNFGLATDNPPSMAVEMLAQHLSSFGMDTTILLPLLSSWLGLPLNGMQMPQLSPQRQKDIILTSTSEIISRIVKSSSAVLMIEDLHWADPTTLELLPKLINQVKQEGILLLMSARPVFTPAWNISDKEMIPIDRLDDADITTIVQSILHNTSVSKDTVAQIVSRVDGVPYFAEEVTKLIRENESSKDAIPTTLRDLLTGKIDQLGPAKETAQLASVLGRTFDYNLIEKVSLKDASSLLADLDQLISAGVMHVRLVVGNPQYVFHHALVRDAAYESLSSKARQEMHFRIAETLERDFAEVIITQPEILAHHWAGAEEFEKAVDNSIKAATYYLSKSLYAESIHHANVSLDWVKSISDEKIRIDNELQLLQLLIPAHIATKGFAAPELDRINCRTDELRAFLPDDSPYLTSILWGYVSYYHVKPDYAKLDKYMNEALEIGTKNGDEDLLSAVLAVKSHFGWSHGTFLESVKNADISIEHYSKKKLRSHGAVFGHDSKVLSLGVKALSLTVYGDLNAADIYMKESIELARWIDEPSSMGLALAYQLCVLHERNEKSIIPRYCDEFREFTVKYGLEFWQNIINLYIGWASSNLSMAEQCLDVFEMIGSGQMLPYWNFIPAQIEYDCEMYSNCLKRIDKYIKHSFDVGEIYYLPELYRLKALCVANLSPDNDDEINSNFKKSLNHAEKIEAHLFKLRTLLDLYRTNKKVKISFNITDQLNESINTFKNKFNNVNHFELDEAKNMIGL